jgi:hypothetical protein
MRRKYREKRILQLVNGSSVLWARRVYTKVFEGYGRSYGMSIGEEAECSRFPGHTVGMKERRSAMNQVFFEVIQGFSRLSRGNF